jgi:energy-coupling factor transport system permease protein
MEARGYRGSEGRTKIRQLKWGAIDSIMMASILLLSIILLLLRA